MWLYLLVARVSLSIVLLVAGFAKARNLGAFRETLLQFRVPKRWSRTVSYAIPSLELACGLGLLFAPTYRWTAGVSILLLSCFTGVLSIAIATGVTPDCNCFGSSKPTPIGTQTIVRNVLFLVLAASLFWPEVLGYHRVVTLEFIVAVALSGTLLLLAGLFVFVLAAVKQNGQLLLRIEALENRSPAGGAAPNPSAKGLALGTKAPSFASPNLLGESIALQRIVDSSHPTVLLFVDPHCGPCRQILPIAQDWQERYPERLSLWLITRSSKAMDRKEASPFLEAWNEPARVLVQKDHEVASLYGVARTPGAVVVSEDGRIASPVAIGAIQISELMEEVAHSVALHSRGA